MQLKRFIPRCLPPLVVVCTLFLATGCERGKPAGAGDSTSVRPSDTSITTPVGGTPNTWISELGPAVLIEGPTTEEAIVVSPSDSAATAAQLQAKSAAAQDVTLFGRGGARILARLGSAGSKQSSDCSTWSLRDLRAEGGATSWSVGFLTAAAAPLALDSVDVLSARDSMTLVAEVSRLASTVTAPTEPNFRGLRFTAHDIRRFQAAPGVAALAAHVIRRVNQEASPLEEQTLLIAERDSGATAGPYHLVYAERSSGLEDGVETPEVIGAAIINRRATLVVARDSDAGVSYSLLMREGPHNWRDRWTSKLTVCN